MSAPDVEKYDNTIWSLDDPDTEDVDESTLVLNQSITLAAGITVPQDYTNSGELTTISSLAEAFPYPEDSFSRTETLNNKFLFQIFSGQGPVARESWSKFLQAAEGVEVNGVSVDGNKVKQAFFNHIAIILGIPYDPDGTGSLGNMEELYQALGGSAAVGSRSEFRDKLIENALDYFFKNYDFTIPKGAYLEDPNDPNSDYMTFGNGGLDPDFDYMGVTRWNRFETDDNVEDTFFESFVHFFSARSALGQDPYYVGTEYFSGPGGTPIADLTTDYLASYERIYNAFVPQPPLKSYEEVLKDFYNKIVDRDGFFLPSQHLKDWIETVQEQQRIQGGTATSVAGTNSQKTAILLSLFKLLVEVIQALQDVARAQGTRLQFYAGYQKAYTDLIKTIPVINKSDVETLLPGDSTANYQRALSFTQSQNQSFTEKVRSFRSIIGDEAKQHQTTVNQSNEIVTQQANLGTSILQELSTILTNMFK